MNNEVLAAKIAFDKNAQFIGENDFSRSELVVKDGKKYVASEIERNGMTYEKFDEVMSLYEFLKGRQISVPVVHGAKIDHIANKVYLVRDYIEGDLMFFSGFERFKQVNKNLSEADFVEDYSVKLDKLTNLQSKYLFKLTRDFIRMRYAGININKTGDCFIVSDNGVVCVDLQGEFKLTQIGAKEAIETAMQDVVTILKNAYDSVKEYATQEQLESLKEQNAMFFSKYASALNENQESIGLNTTRIVREFYNNNEDLKSIVGNMLYNYDCDTMEM